MSNKLITVSLPEPIIWKLGELNKHYGVPKSKLVSQAILLLVSEYASRMASYGVQMGEDYTLEDIAKEYAEREVK